jgi:NAD+ synthase
LGVIEDIQHAAPTDGLWIDNRTDESQIGATYDELEWAMNYEEGAESQAPMTERQKEVFAIFRNFHLANRHKMDPIPVCTIPESLR